MSPGTVIGNTFTVVYPVPTGAGDDLTVYGSCVSQATSASTSNGVLIDVIPLQVPTPFAVPASITVTPPQIHPGEVVHVECPLQRGTSHSGHECVDKSGWGAR